MGESSDVEIVENNEYSSKGGLEEYSSKGAKVPIEPFLEPEEPAPSPSELPAGGRHRAEVVAFTTGDLVGFADGSDYVYLSKDNKISWNYEQSFNTDGAEIFNTPVQRNGRTGTPQDSEAFKPSNGYISGRWEHFTQQTSKHENEKFIIDATGSFKGDQDNKGFEIGGNEYVGDPNLVSSSVKFAFGKDWEKTTDNGVTKYTTETGVRVLRLREDDDFGNVTDHRNTLALDGTISRNHVNTDETVSQTQGLTVGAGKDALNVRGHLNDTREIGQANAKGERDIISSNLAANYTKIDDRDGLGISASVLYQPNDSRWSHLGLVNVGYLDGDNTLAHLGYRGRREGDRSPLKEGSLSTKQTDGLVELDYFREGEEYHEFDAINDVGGQFIQHQAQFKVGFEKIVRDPDGDVNYKYGVKAGVVYFPDERKFEGLIGAHFTKYWGDPAPYSLTTDQQAVEGIDSRAMNIRNVADGKGLYRTNSGGWGSEKAYSFDTKNPAAIAQHFAETDPAALYRLNELRLTGQETVHGRKVTVGGFLSGDKDVKRFYDYLDNGGKGLAEKGRAAYNDEVRDKTNSLNAPKAAAEYRTSDREKAAYIDYMVDASLGNHGYLMTHNPNGDLVKARDHEGNTVKVTSRELAGIWARKAPEAMDELYKKSATEKEFGSVTTREFYQIIHDHKGNPNTLAPYAPSTGGQTITRLATITPADTEQAKSLQAALVIRGEELGSKYNLGTSGQFNDGVDGQWAGKSRNAMKLDQTKLEAEFRSNNADLFKNDRETYNANLADHVRATYSEAATKYSIGKSQYFAAEREAQIKELYSKGEDVKFTPSLDWANPKQVAEHTKDNPVLIQAINTRMKEFGIEGIKGTKTELDQEAYAKWAEGAESNILQNNIQATQGKINREADKLHKFVDAGGLAGNGGLNYSETKDVRAELDGKTGSYRTQIAIGTKADGAFQGKSEAAYKETIESFGVTGNEKVTAKLAESYINAVKVDADKPINDLKAQDWQRVQFALEDSGYRLYEGSAVKDLTGAVAGGRTQTALLQTAIKNGIVDREALQNLEAAKGFDLNSILDKAPIDVASTERSKARAIFEAAVENGDIDTKALFANLNENVEAKANSTFIPPVEYNYTTQQGFDAIPEGDRKVLQDFLDLKGYENYGEFVQTVKASGAELTNTDITKAISSQSETLSKSMLENIATSKGSNFTNLTKESVLAMPVGERAALTAVLNTQNEIGVGNVSNDPANLAAAYNVYADHVVKNNGVENNSAALAEHLNQELDSLEKVSGKEFKQFRDGVIGPVNVNRETIALVTAANGLEAKIPNPKEATEDQIKSLTDSERAAVIVAANHSNVESASNLITQDANGKVQVNNDNIAGITTAVKDFANDKSLANGTDLAKATVENLTDSINRGTIGVPKAVVVDGTSIDNINVPGVRTITTPGRDIASLIGGAPTYNSSGAGVDVYRYTSGIPKGVNGAIAVNIVGNQDKPNGTDHIQFSPNAPQAWKDEFVTKYSAVHGLPLSRINVSELTPELNKDGEVVNNPTTDLIHSAILTSGNNTPSVVLKTNNSENPTVTQIAPEIGIPVPNPQPEIAAVDLNETTTTFVRPTDPISGLPIDPVLGVPVDPITGKPVDPVTGEEIPTTPAGVPIDPTTGNPIPVPPTNTPIDPTTGNPIPVPPTNTPIDPTTGNPIPVPPVTVPVAPPIDTPGTPIVWTPTNPELPPVEFDTPVITPRTDRPDPPEPIDPIDPIDPTPIDPIDPTPIDPIDPTPIDPIDPTPIDPIDPTPIDPIDPTPIDPIDPTPIDPIDPTPIDPIDPIAIDPIDPVTIDPLAIDPVAIDPVTIDPVIGPGGGGGRVDGAGNPLPDPGGASLLDPAGLIREQLENLDLNGFKEPTIETEVASIDKAKQQLGSVQESPGNDPAVPGGSKPASSDKGIVT